MAQNWDYAELSKAAKQQEAQKSMLKCWSL